MLADIGLERATLVQTVDAYMAGEAPKAEPTKAETRMPIETLSWLNMNRRLMTEIANLGPIMITPEGHMKSAHKAA